MPRAQQPAEVLPPGPAHDLVDLFRRLMHGRGLSRHALAAKAGISRSHLSEVVRGRKAPSPEMAARIAAALTNRPGDIAAARQLAERLGEVNRFQRGSDPSAHTKPVPPERSLESGVQFLLALDRAHDAVRGVAGTDPGDLWLSAKRAVHDSGLYEHRERLLAYSSAPIVAAGEAAFLRLIDIRNVIRSGARLDNAMYHDRYHTFAEALWALRIALRAESGVDRLTPSRVGRADWSDRTGCAICGRPAGVIAS